MTGWTGENNKFPVIYISSGYWCHYYLFVFTAWKSKTMQLYHTTDKTHRKRLRADMAWQCRYEVTPLQICLTLHIYSSRINNWMADVACVLWCCCLSHRSRSALGSVQGGPYVCHYRKNWDWRLCPSPAFISLSLTQFEGSWLDSQFGQQIIKCYVSVLHMIHAIRKFKYRRKASAASSTALLISPCTVY